MSQLHHNPETPPEQAQATLLSSYESALNLPPDPISFTLARLQSSDRLLILLNCWCIFCLLFLNCSFVLYLFSSVDSYSIRSMVGITVVPPSPGFLLAVHVPYPLLRSAVVPMVPMFNFCLPLIIIYMLIWFLCPHIPQLGTTFNRVWLNMSVLLLSLLFIRLMNWTKSLIICPCVERLFDFLF